jgi:hypothetical protein
MNLDHLQKKLIAAARLARADERVPYAFEKSVMARLAEASRVDVLGDWSTALWRAAVSCVAVVVLSGAWSMWSLDQNEQTDFSHELETAVFASADSPDDVQ